ncbi:barstar family protein [Streptomyces rishiriensis]|uniref:barstar family protein n=1 Tax=Streptomyces rishiriensis TaxID=68264 RepID=UPI000D597D72|nr:barstar family protein [Streptomyces rishiriensis]
MRRLRPAIGFPGRFGRNWDALVDCLDDLHGHAAGEAAIAAVVHGADALLVIEHFIFLLDEVSAEEFAAEIGDSDVVVCVEGVFLTVALDLAVWRP